MSNLKYGDIIYLNNNAASNRWLSGSRGGSKTEVIIHNYDDDNLDRRSTYQWDVRKDWQETGDGEVYSTDIIFLQDQFPGTGTTWLNGGRGRGQVGVKTYDGEGKFGVQYRWMISTSIKDPKRGSISLGDTVYLSIFIPVNGCTQKFLEGGKNGDIVNTTTSLSDESVLKWTIREI